jgi:hypothetical protein
MADAELQRKTFECARAVFQVAEAVIWLFKMAAAQGCLPDTKFEFEEETACDAKKLRAWFNETQQSDFLPKS